MRSHFLLPLFLFACSSTTTTSSVPGTDNQSDEAITDAGIVDASKSQEASSPPPQHDSGIECQGNYFPCGSICISIGNTCCASVGFPGKSCPNGGTCDPSGICTGNCKQDNHLICSGGKVYSCTGPVSPPQIDDTLACGNPNVGVGQTLYCCIQQCVPPKGAYQYVWKTLSGNCGDIAVGSAVFNGDRSGLLYAAELAELGPSSGANFQQLNNNSSADNCSVSVSASFQGTTIYSDGSVNGSDVVSITSNQGGTQLIGTTTFVEVGHFTCNGFYSFVASKVSQ